ncbi:hypothetical protein ESOMN_v1c03620 [Williamsoniiplasma somnilux]|uniref:Uncharacterized protein n=1 Tax=Williamsoniiplasma somnilux TaxID=215578 RepID=A0A2K8NYC4_9MOLU|nr:hypothetical protein [Williamsoniiplasma somnilux]ATZ18744.1 hypothetical protein ESOMN_v1c03620 [Williamsoniiplasma somnilux]
MKNNSIQKKGDRYYLNDHQYFYLNKDTVLKDFKTIKFPAIIMDTEFFNKSHETNGNKSNLYNEINKDLVYILQYSFAKNFREIYERKNTKSIKSLTIKRSYKDEKYNFKKQYKAMMNSFINMCIGKGIKTLIFAGAANDKKIISSWINSNKKILNNKKTELFVLDEKTQDYSVNSFDIYNILENALSFSNYTSEGLEFYKKQNLEKGKVGEDTISLPSLKKFFDYFNNIFDLKKFEESDDIYKLCCSALKFFSANTMHYDEFIKLNKDVNKAKIHCYNDVLKLLYLIKFLFAFTNFEDINNKYLKGDI